MLLYQLRPSSTPSRVDASPEKPGRLFLLAALPSILLPLLKRFHPLRRPTSGISLSGVPPQASPSQAPTPHERRFLSLTPLHHHDCIDDDRNSKASVSGLAPLHLRRTSTRPVSYYALF